MSDTPQKSWQARIGEATDAIAQSFVESISYDWRLYKADVAGSIAHATMLAKVGLISDSDLKAGGKKTGARSGQSAIRLRSCGRTQR